VQHNVLYVAQETNYAVRRHGELHILVISQSLTFRYDNRDYEKGVIVAETLHPCARFPSFLSREIEQRVLIFEYSLFCYWAGSLITPMDYYL
jgi:hypothetical protein